MRTGTALKVCLAATAAWGPRALGQCPGQWVPGIGAPGVNGTVNALIPWDPDGPGAVPPGLAVGGTFTTAGPGGASRIAWWNPVTGAWSAFGAGVVGGAAPEVHALAVLNSNDLVAAGSFSVAGATAVNNIAGFNGNWYSMFGGCNQRIRALALLNDGSLAAGGEFSSAGAIQANRVARYFNNVVGWGGFGGGTNYDVFGLAQATDLSVYAVETGSGSVTEHLERWNGSTWTGVGGGVPNSIRCVLALPNGHVIIGGAFSTAGGVAANFIARWTGTVFQPLGSGMNNFVLALARANNGDIIAGGAFTMAGGVAANRVARWNGTAWSALGTGTNDIVFALTVMPAGDVIVGGQFTVAGGLAASRIARWVQPLNCYDNCDCSTGTPALTSNDFQCFIDSFAAGASSANCDGSTGAPTLTSNDFQCFLNKFAAGCS